MKPKLIILSVVMILLFITTGLLQAQPDSLSQTGDPEPLIPLTIGNQWISELEFSLNGNVMYTLLDTIKIDTSLEWGGNDYYGTSRDVSKLVGKFLNLFMRNGDGGVWS
ncbi:MAG: hypothetical protein P9M15_01100, partial [Candidatus Electryoneaceae bacterium]|nr:hypothetical protein [Candidatus Electryoneaceae bacterium]